MNKELLTYQTYESPSKTGRVVAGVTIITVGLAILIIYLVNESRKTDEDAYNALKATDPNSPYYVPPADYVPPAPSQTEATTVGELLDELFNFGLTPPTQVQKTGCTISVACNYDPTANILDASMCDFDSCIGLDQPNLPSPTNPDGSPNARYE
jgi:hypothetical protein